MNVRHETRSDVNKTKRNKNIISNIGYISETARKIRKIFL